MKNYWLMKTEPSVFSFEDLLKAPRKTTCWEGVRNFQARNLMRDQFKKGDRILFYHSGIDEPAVVGIAEVVREAYPDAAAEDRRSKYYDPKTAKTPNPWVMVDVRAERPLNPVTRTMLRSDKRTAQMMVLRRGARLSVQPVTQAEFDAVVSLGLP